MVANLDLPRSAWTDHPHYPGNVLLLGSHENFRHVSATLLSRAEKGGDARGILAVFRAWKAAMHSHEKYEEYKLYPYLAHRFGVDPASMEQGHQELAVEDQRVRDAVDKPADVFAALLRRHHEALLEHLEHEENLVIPALLALTPKAFEEYRTHDLAWLLAHHPAAGAEDDEP